MTPILISNNNKVPKMTKKRYSELKLRIDSFKKKDHYLYDTYLNQIKDETTHDYLL